MTQPELEKICRESLTNIGNTFQLDSYTRNLDKRQASLPHYELPYFQDLVSRLSSISYTLVLPAPLSPGKFWQYSYLQKRSGGDVLFASPYVLAFINAIYGIFGYNDIRGFNSFEAARTSIYTTNVHPFTHTGAFVEFNIRNTLLKAPLDLVGEESHYVEKQTRDSIEGIMLAPVSQLGAIAEERDELWRRFLDDSK